jgi:hypothetical protein
MHATDLVGINGITRVLLAYTCQQGVYPRGHVLPFDSLLSSLFILKMHVGVCVYNARCNNRDVRLVSVCR